MGKLFGWILMLVGLALIAGKFMFKDYAFFSKINILLAVVIGLILIVAGFLFLKEKKEKQEEELPIYQGEGRKRKIVGYKRMK